MHVLRAVAERRGEDGGGGRVVGCGGAMKRLKADRAISVFEQQLSGDDECVKGANCHYRIDKQTVLYSSPVERTRQQQQEPFGQALFILTTGSISALD